MSIKLPELNIGGFGFTSENRKEGKEYIKRIFNLVSFISVVVTLCILWISVYYEFDKSYTFFALAIPVIFLMVLVLDILNREDLLKVFGTTLLPAWLNITALCTGGGFSETPVMLAFLMFTYILYYQEPILKFKIIAFNMISHILVLAHNAFYEPLLYVVDYPFDEVVVFCLSLAWIFVFLKKYEYERSNYIFELQKNNETLLQLQRNWNALPISLLMI